MPLVNHARTNRPVFDIDLDARPYDRWQHVGRRNKAKLGRFLRDIADLAKDGMVDWINQPSAWVPDFIRSTVQRPVGPLLDCARRLGSLMARSFGKDYQAEIRGLAIASGLMAGDALAPQGL